jgi:DNA-binding response OmpR family regulator
MILAMLLQAGYDATVKDSASRGWIEYAQAKADEQPYDLLILDIAMPDETGLKLAQRIRDSGDTETRLIIFTGFDGAINRQQAKDLDAVYLVKPPDLMQMRAVIAELLDVEAAGSGGR